MVLYVLGFMTAVTLFLLRLFSEKYVTIRDLNAAKKMLELTLYDSILQDKGTGCVMPKVDPFSEQAMKYTRDVPKLICEGTDWVECYRSQCYVTEYILKKMKDISCTYKDIIYKNDDEHIPGEPVKLTGNEIYNLSASDHVKVSCNGKEFNSVFLPTRWYGNKAGLRPIEKRESPPGRESSFNVLILAFDSTSHNGFIRKMPLTYKVLKEDLQAVILNSYNIVGDGTPAAMLPILTGKPEVDLPDSRKKFSTNYFDEKLLIFHQLHQDGYHTAYFEDTPWAGTFTYRFNGFGRQPADHWLMPVLHEEAHKGATWWWGPDNYRCFGAAPIYTLLLNLTRQFFQSEGKKFGLTFIADISHNDFNLISTSDEDVRDFLMEFKNNGSVEDTFIIVMGDHGARYAEIRSTYQGKVEERLPLMSLILPERLKRDRPEALEALKSNVDTLTTPFDIHSTILDVLGMTQHWNKYRVPGADLPMSMTLLRSIPKSRSCGEAAVQPHWCACARWTALNTTHPMYGRVAQLLTHYINDLTEDMRSVCAERRLLTTEWVIRQEHNDNVVRFKEGYDSAGFIASYVKGRPKDYTVYYQAKIVLSPAKGDFEGTVRHYVEEDRFTITEKDISRTNAYNSEPDCVSATHPHLNKYCYCRDKLLLS